jgi:hypothetical protein
MNNAKQYHYSAPKQLLCQAGGMTRVILDHTGSATVYIDKTPSIFLLLFSCEIIKK